MSSFQVFLSHFLIKYWKFSFPTLSINVLHVVNVLLTQCYSVQRILGLGLCWEVNSL